MNTLKIKINTKCSICKCKLIRKKSIKVHSNDKENAILEAKNKTDIFFKDIQNNKQHCKTCMSIINSFEIGE